MSPDSALQTQQLTLSYGQTIIIEELDLHIPRGKITALVGRNGCGKSTLLRAMARLLKPKKGTVLLNGREIAKQSTREIAKRMAILPQSPMAPEGISVIELVKQGRYPHQNWLQQWSEEDERKVYWALRAAGLEDLADRPVNAMSGGQMQRAWIAMVLAQDTDIILLDEPTTYLDMNHQIEVLDLLYELNEREQRTVVMVLHDLNLACRYAHHMVVVHEQNVRAQGKPESIINEALVEQVFGISCHITADPIFGTPVCIPHGKGRIIRR